MYYRLRPTPRERTAIRCLFINWNDATPPSQFTVPDNYHLEADGTPAHLTIFNDQFGSELMLNVDEILSAYLLDIAADRTITQP